MAPYILNFGEEYSTFNQITGLAWHPTINGVQVEVMYFDLLDRFLTEGFRNAKEEGDEALIEYFHALNGVCFEDRMRNIEEYMTRQECPEVLYCADYDSKNTAEEVFEKEAAKLFEISGNKVPSPIEFRDHLTSRGVFTTKFSKGLDSKEVPSLEQFQKWVIANQSMYIINPYTSLDEFLSFEFEIFHSSVESASADVFIDQVSRETVRITV